jgi:hypothetical protein
MYLRKYSSYLVHISCRLSTRGSLHPPERVGDARAGQVSRLRKAGARTRRGFCVADF